MTNIPSDAQSSQVLRYSSRPRASYTRTSNGHACGPATSPLLDTTEIWNLAYLSHDFETALDHPDPQFKTNVRRTCQTLLDGSGIDLTGLGATPRTESLLRSPAPRFVYLILRHPILQKLPLYTAYGLMWLHLIDQRSRICHFENDADGTAAVDEATDLSVARSVLDRVRSVR